MDKVVILFYYQKYLDLTSFSFLSYKIDSRFYTISLYLWIGGGPKKENSIHN